MYEIRTLGLPPPIPTRQQVLEQAVTDALRAVGLEPHPAGTWNVTPGSFEELVRGVLRIGNSLAPAYEYNYFEPLEAEAELRQRGYVRGEERPPIPQPNGGPGAEDTLPPLQQPPPAFPLWLLLLGLGVFAFAGRDNKRKRKSQGQAATLSAIPADQYLLLSGEGCRDAEGKFIPVPQCVASKRELWQMSRTEAEAEQRQLNRKAIEIIKAKAEKFPEAHGRYVPKKGRTLSDDIATRYLAKKDADRYKQLMYFAHKAAVEDAISRGKKVSQELRQSVGLEGTRRVSFLSGEGCRDADGKFIPVTQCTGRLPKKKAKKPPLTADEWKVLQAFKGEKIHIDEVARRTKLAPYKVSSALVMLELKSLAHQSAGKMFEATVGKPAMAGYPKKERGRRLYYMWAGPGGWPEDATSIPKSKLKDYQRTATMASGTLFYIWAESADQAREILRTDPDARRQSYRQGDPSLSGFPALGSPGAQASCALWQEKYSPFYGEVLWKCLKYAPACEPQIPNGKVCVVAPAAEQKRQLRVCVDSKGVKSDPAGRYKGKTIQRCAEYSAVCTTKACLPEPMPKPEMEEEPVISEKEVKALARGMAQEWNETQAAAGPALAREILSRGGIRSYRRGVEKEEYREIPLHLKKKKGLPMDEMAAEMGIDEKELMAAIKTAYPKGRKVERRKKWQDFIEQARDIIMTDYREGLRGLAYPAEDQPEMFKAKRELVLTPEDIATADDPLYICLQRMGWKLPRVQKLQVSIAEKMTPDLFTGKKGRLTGGEKMLQEQIDKCFQRIAAGRRTGKPKQMKLFGPSPIAGLDEIGVRRKGQPPVLKGSFLMGTGCRDEDGKFIPTWQCTGRPRPKNVWTFLERTPRQIIYKAKGHEGLVMGDTKKFSPTDQKHISEIFNDTREVLSKYRRIRNYYGFTKETLKRENLRNPHTNIIHDLVPFDRYFGMGSSGIDRRGVKFWWYSPALSRQATEKLKQMVEATPPAAIAHEVTHTIGSTRELINPLSKAVALRFYLRHPNYVTDRWLSFEVENALREGLGKKSYNIETVKAVYEANPKYVDNILEKYLAPKDQERLRQAIK